MDCKLKYKKINHKKLLFFIRSSVIILCFLFSCYFYIILNFNLKSNLVTPDNAESTVCYWAFCLTASRLRFDMMFRFKPLQQGYPVRCSGTPRWPMFCSILAPCQTVHMATISQLLVAKIWTVWESPRTGLGSTALCNSWLFVYVHVPTNFSREPSVCYVYCRKWNCVLRNFLLYVVFCHIVCVKLMTS